ncbi:carboxypeptidase regulatory-like domain-containing protein [Paenibacillus sp. N3.4]|uniref:carboxypeptidase regulatory-like domain-containing protein n=1 Tax=Paenibacillus sp. N3.4 TaxID=2603222 RepID=UPI0011CA9A1C|nr:carboxypeptidase regulatory-like domain-containing protein [Paenibacillus sp. N3.4]TXK83596.1 hypothetical protein FU659_12695 [Paenibacillus sp. N3.4]
MLQRGEGKFTGTFQIKEGITDIDSVKANLIKEGTDLKSAEKVQQLNKKVGATLSGRIKQGGVSVKGNPLVEFIINGQYLQINADNDGNFTLAGVPKGNGKLNVVSSERYLDVVNEVATEYGTTKAMGDINLPLLKNVKVRLLDQDSKQPVNKSLRVSISGPASKEGYIGQDGYFMTYSGESELKRLKPGVYMISVIGEGEYEGLKDSFTIDESTDYLVNPISIYVKKKIKEIANATIELFMPEGTQTNHLDSYYMYSTSAAQAFGWDVGYSYGYNQTMTVSERVYVTNPQHVLGGGTSTTVAEQVYGYMGRFTVSGLAAASDYSFNLSLPGFQPLYKSPVSIHAGNQILQVGLQPAVVYTGRIVGTNGNPIAGADVSASAGGTYTYARTDAEGRYTLDRLAESNQVQLQVQAIGFTNYNETQTVSNHQLPDITLENDKFIHGKVLDKDGIPLKHVYVYANGNKNNGWARTDDNGYFKIRGLSAGTYSINANLYGYPSYMKDFNTDTVEISIVMKSQNSQFSGEGNSFAPSVTTVVNGKEMSYRLNYKNGSNSSAKSTVWNFDLPSSVKLVDDSVELNGKTVHATGGSLLQLPVGDIAAGASGTISFKVLVNKADEASIRTVAYPVINGKKEEPTQIATTSVLYVTLNAPAVTGDKKIKVYGNTKPGSTVEIFAGAVSLGRVTAEGRWWYADVVLPVSANTTEAEYKLTAHVVENDQNESSEITTVKYTAGIPGLDEALITAGWNVNVKLNPKISVATLAITEKTPIQTKVTFKEAVDEASIEFIGSKYSLTKAADGKTFTGEVPYGWSSYGEQMLILTYKKNGVSVSIPLMEVIVLIDPSGYVFEGSMENRLPGVTAVVQQYDGNTNQWSGWDAENYGQINPQTTDAEGRYGWDVLKGQWRVQFSKQGFEDYTSRKVIVPPAETELNVPLVRTSVPQIVSVTPADNTNNISGTTDIEIVFDRPMDEAGIDASTISLVQVQGNQETPVNVTFGYQHMKSYKENTDPTLKNNQLLDGNNQSGWFIADDTKKLTKKLTLKPNTVLAQGTKYKVNIKGNFFDYSGSNVLAVNKSYTFTTASVTPPPPANNCCGGGGGGPSTAANEVDLDFVALSKLVTNNEVKVVLTDKQDTLLVSSNVWNVMQSRGYTVKLQQKDAFLTIPVKAFSLKDDETLALAFKPSNAANLSGYKVSSSVIHVEVAKQKNGKKEEANASVPLTLRLTASPSNEPSLIGAYEFVNGNPKYLGRALDVEFKATGTFGLAQFERSFTDLDDHWAKQDIRYLVSHHIVDGATDTAFDPSGTTTRGQVAKLLAEMLQLEKTDAKSTFTDVSGDAWYASYVASVEKAGIFQGANGQFRPEAAISRQELAVVISRLLKKQDQAKDKDFADQTQIADWAQVGVGTAVKLGIIQGDDAGKFLPEAKATRAEAAAMVRRLIQVLDKENQ